MKRHGRTPYKKKQLEKAMMDEQLQSFEGLIRSIYPNMPESKVKDSAQAQAQAQLRKNQITRNEAMAHSMAASQAAAPAAAKGGSKKKRTVTIKSDAMPKTVKGLETRKKLLKEKIKDVEKKVKLNKNRVIKLK